MPLILSTALGLRPRAVLKTSGTVFSHTDRPSPVNNIFIFFGRLLFKAGKGIGIKDIAYVASRVLKKHQIKKTKQNNVSIFQRLFILTREYTDTRKEPANNMLIFFLQ